MPTSPKQTTGDLEYRLVRGSYRLLGGKSKHDLPGDLGRC